jgi:LmbE family N-acetylglucosaminyl deacetylase
LFNLALPSPASGPFRLLCLGAHADDVEIGCGGTVLRLAAQIPGIHIRWIVFSGDGVRESEARSSAATFLNGVADQRVDVLKFRDGYFPFYGADIKDAFEKLKREIDPTLILVHGKDDAHQDHRLIAELTYNTFRNHLVWEYEIPKYDGDLGNPNLFVPLTRAMLQQKLDALKKHFPSQHGRGWFTDETFLGLARLRGIGCNAPEGLAEAFTARKLVV